MTIIITEHQLELQEGFQLVNLFKPNASEFSIDFSRMEFVSDNKVVRKNELQNIHLLYKGKKFLIKLTQRFQFKFYGYTQGTMTKQNQKVITKWLNKDEMKSFVVFNWIVNLGFYFGLLKELYNIQNINTDKEFFDELNNILKLDFDYQEFLNSINSLSIPINGKKTENEDEEDDEPIIQKIHKFVIKGLTKYQPTTKNGEVVKKYFANKTHISKSNYFKPLSTARFYSFTDPKTKKLIEGVNYESRLQFKILTPDKKENGFMTVNVRGKDNIKAMVEDDFEINPDTTISPRFTGQMILTPELNCITYKVGVTDGLSLSVKQIKLKHDISKTEGVKREIMLDFDEVEEDVKAEHLVGELIDEDEDY